MALQIDDVATYFVVISVVAPTLLIEGVSCV